MNEKEAIAQLKQGHIGGLQVLVSRYQVKAVHVAQLITRDRQLAEDTVQAAFLRAFERIDQFDAERAFGPSWLTWQAGELMYVLEAHGLNLSADAMIQIAETLEPLPSDASLSR